MECGGCRCWEKLKPVSAHRPDPRLASACAAGQRGAAKDRVRRDGVSAGTSELAIEIAAASNHGCRPGSKDLARLFTSSEQPATFARSRTTEMRPTTSSRLRLLRRPAAATSEQHASRIQKGSHERRQLVDRAPLLSRSIELEPPHGGRRRGVASNRRPRIACCLMAVPDYQTLMLPVLRLLGDGGRAEGRRGHRGARRRVRADPG